MAVLPLAAALVLAGCRPPAAQPVGIAAPLLQASQAAAAPAASATPSAMTPFATSTPAATATPAPTATPVFSICSPLAENSLQVLREIISDPYRPPPPGSDERHQGVDFSYYRRGSRTSILGEGVQAVLAGKVAMAQGDSFPFGNSVIVETPSANLPPALAQALGVQAGESLYVLYAHLLGMPEVKPGEAVAACQRLGQVGSTGNSGVAHLHLETRLGPPGETILAMRYYLANTTPEQRAAYTRWTTSGVFRHFDPLVLLGVK